MNLLFLCGREVSYPLNQTLLHSFRQFSSVDVVSEQGSGKSIIRRSLSVFAQAVPQLIHKKYDLVFVGFFGHFLMPAVRRITHAPILFHPFISTYETLIFDRKKASPESVQAKVAFQLDSAAFHAADHLLLDTKANVRYFSNLFNVPPDRFSVMLMGSDENLFYPRDSVPGNGKTVVLYHGAFLPLQGIDSVIEAANLLRDNKNICFRLLGGGLDYKRISQRVQELCLKNVEFVPAVPLHQLPEQIAQSSICLGGHFGTSDKAARVIAGKTFQDIAMGKATIVGDNAANLELLTHGKDAWFVPMNDANALAEAVRLLAEDIKLRETIGQNAHETFMRHASLQVLTPQLKQVAEKAILSRS